MLSEERIRRAIRERLRDQYGVSNTEEESTRSKAFKPYGTEQDEKLEREVPKNAQEPEAAEIQMEEQEEIVLKVAKRQEVDQESKEDQS